jgi:two-component system sensor histidine kinase CiaH
VEQKLKRRFVFYNILVICAVTGVMLAFSGLHAGHGMTAGRTAGWLIVMAAVTAGASVLLSRIALAPIRKAWQRQLDFTADASHELRTPLAALQLNLEIAMEEPEKTIGEQRQWLENTAQEAARLSELVDGLLTLSRADTGRQELILRETALDALIAEALEPLRPQAQAAGLTVETALEPQLTLRCDGGRISQLVTILADNAIKYAGAGSVLRVAAQRAGDRVVITVGDNGAGIPPEQLPMIFDRFYRADPARSAQKPGSGLGLSIAKWIVEAHGGTISAQSAVGGGTTFTILLPETTDDR